MTRASTKGGGCVLAACRGAATIAAAVMTMAVLPEMAVPASAESLAPQTRWPDGLRPVDSCLEIKKKTGTVCGMRDSIEIVAINYCSVKMAIKVYRALTSDATPSFSTGSVVPPDRKEYRIAHYCKAPAAFRFEQKAVFPHRPVNPAGPRG